MGNSDSRSLNFWTLDEYKQFIQTMEPGKMCIRDRIMTDPFVGKLAYFRVYSGTLNSGSYVLNATKDKKRCV